MLKLRELAELTGGTVRGNPELSITGFCSLENPSPTSISFLERSKDAAKLSNIMLGAIVTTDALAHFFPDTIVVANPKLAFIQIMEKFLDGNGRGLREGRIHGRAVVDPDALIAESTQVEPNAVIASGVRIGERCFIGPNCYLGRNVVIGDDCYIHANVSIYSGSRLGSHIEIQSGTVIGSAGFGYVPTKEGHRRFPQVGSVVIEDHVEIGANCCIDRAALDETVIHAGTKIDNLVQIAHGVRVGNHCVIAAQTGVSGGTSIGNWCVIGGQAGFQGHITVGDQSIVAAQSGVFSDLPFQSKVSGYPARPHAQSLKVLALTFKLPELMEKMKSLEIDLDMIQGELQAIRRKLGGSSSPGGSSGGSNNNPPPPQGEA
jgi:UDP-3-O-[3-hydroxymyristoyl] glucosamine N-acyltransferase